MASILKYVTSFVFIIAAGLSLTTDAVEMSTYLLLFSMWWVAFLAFASPKSADFNFKQIKSNNVSALKKFQPLYKIDNVLAWYQELNKIILEVQTYSRQIADKISDVYLLQSEGTITVYFVTKGEYYDFELGNSISEFSLVMARKFKGWNLDERQISESYVQMYLVGCDGMVRMSVFENETVIQ